MALLSVASPRRLIAAAAIWAAVSTPLGAGQRTSTAEDDIKAAFLFNFTQFVEWPPAADAGEPFRICVVADSEFGTALERIVSGESVGRRPIARAALASPDDAHDCQILFLGRQEPERLDRWLAAVKGRPVLIVAESAGALERGAHIVFVVENNRVKFDVDKDKADSAGLVISSKLLRVARHVTARRDE